MTAYSEFLRTQRRYRNGERSFTGTLISTAGYLEASADWIAVRDFLIDIGMTRSQILDWFSEQDFPDFSEAVEQGWGWGNKPTWDEINSAQDCY